MNTACTPAWMTRSWPDESTTAMLIAMTTTSAICQAPLPSTRTTRSPTSTPIATPMRHLGHPPQALPVGEPEAEDRRHGGEERRRVAEHVLGDEPRDEHRDADLDDEHPAVPQPSHATGQARAQRVDGHAAPVRSTRCAVSRGRATTYTESSWAAQRSQCGA